MPPDVATEPSVNPAVTPPSAPATPAAPVVATPAADAPWYAGIEDADLRGWTELKGWKSPSDVAKSARESEQLLGKVSGAGKDQLLILPKDLTAAKDEELGPIYDRLGRPKTAGDYKLEVPAGDNGEFAKAIAPILHKHGITARQAEGLAKDWNALMAGTLEATNAQGNTQLEADKLNLQREWGSSFTKREELGRRVFRQFSADMGGSPEENKAALAGLEKAFMYVDAEGNSHSGYAPLMRLFASIGEKLGEANFHDGENTNPGFSTMTPEAARAQLKILESDKEWGKKFLDGGEAERIQRDNLLRIAGSGNA